MRTITLLLILSLFSLVSRAANPAIRNLPWEETFTAKADAPSTTDLRVEFTSPNGKTTTVPGFWDGGKTWRVRFMPTEIGEWTHVTKSTPPIEGLHDVRGNLEVIDKRSTRPFEKEGPLKIGKNKTHLAYNDDTPFFFLADTCWTGPALSSKEDWDEYLKKRSKQGFTSIQYNALSPWRCAPTDAEGLLPYVTKPEFGVNPEYFKRLDERINAINAAGLLATHVMVWANKKGDAGIDLKPEQLERLLKYQVARYGANNIFWILVGDNKYAPESAEQWKKLGRAVFADPTFDSRTHVVTTHPTGMNWPWKDWENEKWLNVLGYQSGHGDGDKTWQWITSGPPAEYGKQKNITRPVINLEPPYEDHVAYQSKQPHDELNVRRAMIWSLLNAPTAGVTYGGHGVWSWHTKPGEAPTDHPGTGKAKVWREALELEGAKSLRHLKVAFERYPWHELRPAQELLVTQPGEKDAAAWVSVAATPDRSLVALYAPQGVAEIRLPGEGERYWGTYKLYMNNSTSSRSSNRGLVSVKNKNGREEFLFFIEGKGDDLELGPVP
jgi:hypothetical protein